MRSILTVATPASNRALLTIDELRAAAGVVGNSQDTALEAMGLRIADAIASECNVVPGTGAIPTLLREALVETMYGVRCTDLVLARRHDVEITSILSDGAALTDFVVDPESAIVTKLENDMPKTWHAQKVVVTYSAGLTTVPGDLKQAALEFFRWTWQSSKRDPALKSEVVDVPDVERTEKNWWVGSVPGQAGAGVVPDVVVGMLRRYRNITLG